MVLRGFSAVVLDIQQERINELSLEDLSIFVPGLTADADLPGNLQLAGLGHRFCRGVVALTDSDQVNLKIAITARLLNPALTVVCRAHTHDAQNNMLSFGTDAVINPFDTFADRLAMALHSPDMHLIYEWLTAMPGRPLAARIDPPRGTWLVCGYGRFGKAVDRYLKFEGVSTVIVEYDPTGTGAPADAVVGRGTEAVTLRAAHVEKAVGIVAGTDDDANNLSIIMTARTLNPGLFMVARQNQRDNDAIFDAAGLDLVMQRSRIIARRILSLITTPLLTDFLRLARHKNDAWAAELAGLIRGLVPEAVPEVWAISLDDTSAPAVCVALMEERMIRLRHLMCYPGDRTRPAPCLALLLRRGSQDTLLPSAEQVLRAGDQLLFCGRTSSPATMQRALVDHNVLRYVETGELRPDGYVWRWFATRRR
jgi:Trk K+ transport system NAD-binding subunit